MFIVNLAFLFENKQISPYSRFIISSKILFNHVCKLPLLGGFPDQMFNRRLLWSPIVAKLLRVTGISFILLKQQKSASAEKVLAGVTTNFFFSMFTRKVKNNSAVVKPYLLTGVTRALVKDRCKSQVCTLQQESPKMYTKQSYRICTWNMSHSWSCISLVAAIYLARLGNICCVNWYGTRLSGRVVNCAISYR